MDGLALLLTDRAPDDPVTLSEVRARTARSTSSVRVAQVLDDLQLLRDDTTPAIRAWIERRTAELPTGFAGDVRAWLLVLLDGDARTHARAQSSIYVYYGAIRPLLQGWAASRDHLREITTADVTAALAPMRGWPRRTTISALRSLFRFAKKRHLIFTDPSRIVPSPMWWPSLASSPWTRRCSHRGFSRARRITSSRSALSIRGRPAGVG
jgi:hypothetical protein